MGRYYIKPITTILLLFFVTLTACSKDDAMVDPEETNSDSSVGNDDNQDDMKIEKMILTVGSRTLEVELARNSSVDALVEVLKKAPVTVSMSDYGNMEKVGSLGQSFPRNDMPIATEAGDVILYQGNMLVIYYAPNSWSFTRLGKIKNITAQTLKEVLGNSDVTVVLSLPAE